MTYFSVKGAATHLLSKSMQRDAGPAAVIMTDTAPAALRQVLLSMPPVWTRRTHFPVMQNNYLGFLNTFSFNPSTVIGSDFCRVDSCRNEHNKNLRQLKG